MVCALSLACFHSLDREGLSSLAIRWIELILLYCFWVLIAVIAGYAGSSWGAVLFLIAFWYYCSILKPVSWRCSNVGYPIVLISCDYPSVSIFYTQACTVLPFNFFSRPYPGRKNIGFGGWSQAFAEVLIGLILVPFCTAPIISYALRSRCPSSGDKLDRSSL